MKRFYFLLLLAGSIIMSSCDKQKEVVGPTGANGTDGVNGTNGTNGTNGSDGFLKQGSISGTIVGKRSDGEPINETFKYEVFTTLEQSQVDGGDGYNVSVRRSDIDQNSYLSIYFYSNDMSVKPDSNDVDLDFQYIKSLTDSTYLKFQLYNGSPAKESARYFSQYDGDSRLTISNYSYNQKTGQLKFDYKIDIVGYENYSGNPATVTGTVDVQVKQPLYKKAN